MPGEKQISRMFDSFEGGVYTSHWDVVSGGGIGFGCKALLPYAHGKTLYFNGCDVREARTVEMDLTTARYTCKSNTLYLRCACNKIQVLNIIGKC